MGRNKNKPRLPEKQASLVQNFRVKNDKQKELVELIETHEIVIATGPAGTGKAQPLYSLVYTPNGPKQMKDIYVGETVCTPDGKHAQVINIFPQGVKDCYRVYFSDGVHVDCCSDHLWKVATYNDRRVSENKFHILTTKEMIGSIMYCGKKNYKLPITKPIYYFKQEIKLDPYLIGLLIGDGGMTGANTVISTKDMEILESINEIVKPFGLHTYPTKQTINGNACDYIIGIYNRDELKENEVTRISGQLGIRCKSEYKDIPELYLYNTIEHRIALLQGLMDSDGTVDKRNGSVTYSTSSLKLKESFCQLIRSLGGIATVSVKKTKCLDNYVITINLPNEINPFRLTRKRELVIPKTKYLTPRYIENIEYIGQVEQQCIEIDSEDHLYITDNHIVTHNTYVTLATALNLLSAGYKKVILVKSVTTIPGEEIGFLKGNMEQKMEPFIMSYMWNIDKICGDLSAQKLLDAKIIEVLPLAFIRGLSIDNSIVIIDEVQNIDSHTFKTLMTRIGENSKYILLGDTEQIDRRKKIESCLSTVVEIFKDSPIIGTIEFTDEDCVRNPIIPIILAELRNNGI